MITQAHSGHERSSITRAGRRIALGVGATIPLILFAAGTASANGMAGATVYGGNAASIAVAITGATPGESCAAQEGGNRVSDFVRSDGTLTVQLSPVHDGTHTVHVYCDGGDLGTANVVTSGVGGGGAGGGTGSNARSNTGIENGNPVGALIKIISTLVQ
jgi:hypothetical protein